MKEIENGNFVSTDANTPGSLGEFESAYAKPSLRRGFAYFSMYFLSMYF